MLIWPHSDAFLLPPRNQCHLPPPPRHTAPTPACRPVDREGLKDNFNPMQRLREERPKEQARLGIALGCKQGRADALPPPHPFRVLEPLSPMVFTLLPTPHRDQILRLLPGVGFLGPQRSSQSWGTLSFCSKLLFEAWCDSVRVSLLSLLSCLLGSFRQWTGLSPRFCPQVDRCAGCGLRQCCRLVGPFWGVRGLEREGGQGVSGRARGAK